MSSNKGNKPGEESEKIFKSEKAHAAHNFKSLPVVLKKGKGIFLWDVEGHQYYDFLSAYSAVNQGHCHPRIIEALTTQANTLTITSKAFYNNKFSKFAEYATKLFGYDKVLPMNGGNEASETACKLARAWGYIKKKIPTDQAVIVFAEGNYWGSSMSAISTCTDPYRTNIYGPLMSGFRVIPYSDLNALKEAFESDPNICAFMIEPIQGEQGIIVPHEGYLKGVRELCTRYNVLWIDDEVQAGLGRSGALLAADHENVRPDIVCIGKSLSGGTLPVSIVLADDEVMLCMGPGQHVTTFGGNPLASAVALVSLQVIVEEKLAENSKKLGGIFKAELERLPKEIVSEVRGKGLFRAIVIREDIKVTANDICIHLRNNGLLAKNTHINTIRLMPPLIITEKQLLECTQIIYDTITELKTQL